MNRPENHVICRPGKMFCVSLRGTELTADERRMFELVRPGSVLLFARNCQNPEQVSRLTAEIRGLLGDDTLIAIDQEGGRVDRLRELLAPMPAAEEVARTGGVAAAETLGSLTGRALRQLGLNFNFAPVLDYLPPEKRAVKNGLETRLWGLTPQAVADCGLAFLSSLQNEGVIGCVKHFPGLGGATLDPHEDFPVVKTSAEELTRTDLLPFRQAIATGQAHAVMVSHAAYPALEAAGADLVPASLSPGIVSGLLRDQMKFSGVTVTDDLMMGAVTRAAGSLAEAVRQAVIAGQNLLLVSDAPDEVISVFEQLHRFAADDAFVTEQIARSLQRLDKLRAKAASPVRFDAAEIQSLSAEIARFRQMVG